MPSAAEVAGTESLDNGLAMETLVFPAYPIGKHHVQVVHDLDKFCLSQMLKKMRRRDTDLSPVPNMSLR